MTVYFKQNDSFQLSLTLLGADGTAQDLSGATAVVLSMRNTETDALVINRQPCVVVSAIAGTCTFAGAAEVTENFGTFQYEIEVTFTDGGIVTFPTEGYETVVIVRQIA